jgi:hypothetical protein
MDDRAIQVRSPAEAKDFSSNLWVHTGSGAHVASCPMSTGVLSPGVKRGRGVTLTTHPYLVPRSWMSRSYTSSPLPLHRCVVGLLCFCFRETWMQNGYFNYEKRNGNSKWCPLLCALCFKYGQSASYVEPGNWTTLKGVGDSLVAGDTPTVL